MRARLFVGVLGGVALVSIGCGEKTFEDLAGGKWNVAKEELAAVKAIIASSKTITPKDVIAYERYAGCYHGNCKYVVVADGHIVRMRFANAGVTQIDALAKLKHLKKAEFQKNNIAAVKGICGGAERLTRLDVRGSKTKSFAPGPGCKVLRTLSLRDNGLETLELVDMPKLRILKLDKNALRRASFKNLPAITSLTLSKQQLTRVPTLAGMTGLTGIYLKNNKITSLVGLPVNSRLSLIDASFNKLSSIRGVGTQKQLSTLRVTSNQITQLGLEQKVPRLALLNVTNNKLKKMDSLDKLPLLSSLYAEGNELDSLAAISRARFLRVLNVNKNKLTTLSSLSGVDHTAEKPPTGKKKTRKKAAKAKRGELAKAAKVAGSGTLIFLKTLTARENRIASLAGVEYAPYVKSLNLGKNKLQNLAGIERLAKLEELIVDRNQLTSVRGVKKLPKLKVLIASHNQLKDSSEVYASTTVRPGYKHYDFRHNLYTGIAAGLLFYGVMRTGYVMGGYRRRHRRSYYGGVRTGSSRSRYGSSGGYRYGK